jgi:hypothetical protein
MVIGKDVTNIFRCEQRKMPFSNSRKNYYNYFSVFPTKKFSNRNFRKTEIKSKFPFRRKISAKIEFFCLLSYLCLTL